LADRPELALWLIVGLAIAKLALHGVTSIVTPYEFHRDEFLYFAMGEHLSLFRMDFPPAIAMLAQSARGLLGDSLFAIRLVPAAFSTAIVVLAALVAREFGGGRGAQGLAAACVIANPLFLRSGVLFQPVVLDQFAWTLGFYALARLVRTDDLRWWAVLGAATGFGLLAKLTIGVFGAAAMAALLLTRRWVWIRDRGPWLALGVAALIGIPTVVGQIVLDFPAVSYLADLQHSQLTRVTAADFVVEQLVLGPSTFVAVAGLVFLLGAWELKPFRLLGWVIVVTCGLMLLLKAKGYYFGPVYPMACAAGAVGIVRVPYKRLGRLLYGAVMASVVGFAIVTLPLGLPILPPARMAAYAARIGGEAAVTTNVGAVEQLPQDYADMLGWHQLVRDVRDVYDVLPADDRERAVLLASNYGEAGAIDFYGPRYGLPRAVAFVGTYWHYGPGEKPGDVVIAIGFAGESVARRFDAVEAVATVGHPYGVEEQREQTIYLGRGPRQTLQELWPGWKGQN
jgi:hypothetical protein